MSCELCRVPEECASYQSYLRSNVTPPANLCSPNYCTIQSTCDGAWTLPYSPNNLNSGSCCGGVSMNQKCTLLSGEVNSCSSGSWCHIDKPGFTQQRGVSESGICHDVNEKNSIWVGVVLVLLGGTTLNIGLNLQKFALRKNQEKKKIAEQHSEVTQHDTSADHTNQHHSLLSKASHSLTKSNLRLNPFVKVWVVGFAIYVAASLLNFVALQFAPQSLVAPLGAISLVTNVVIAPLMNKESLGKFDILGVMVIIGGCVLVVVFSGVVVQVVIFGFIVWAFFYIKIMEKNMAPETSDIPMAVNPTHSPATLEVPRNPTDNRDSTLTSSETLTNVEIQNTHNTLKESDKEKRESSMESLDEPDSNCDSAPKESVTPTQSVTKWDFVKRLYKKIVWIPTLPRTIPRTSPLVRYVLPLSYAAIGAMMATMTTLFAKSLINLLSVSIIQKENQFTSALAWVILIVTIITAFSQVYWINMGLKRYDAMLQVPVFYVIWSVFDIIGGGK
ncbi:hypothetical protein K493DRAFT_304606 [Basidiobolus meristosporus CBS 931.73]|uniref:Uncharacterized protein n=1 Tax=Basidiobolus meristosporus CBS 931.73 TaxID=1314790 RepID=A0A1Y1XYI8_9FUNG|nr:hypothetical protein K493DRAFT_304606 [Basidiobolus meristosporus CBS 931.73]|eukprot:ORX90792.1 hypothetical protein K493DRAFT_304606 [Basidiobolus meristosporus CBS 931.73]